MPSAGFAWVAIQLYLRIQTTDFTERADAKAFLCLPPALVCVTYYVTYSKVGAMIRSFRDKDTEALYEGRKVRKFQTFQKQAERRMQILDSATAIEDLMLLPSNRFETLSGDRKGQHSIRINQQWRICFEWHEDGPHNVEIVDYH